MAGPAFAESISEGDIRWVKAVGDFVQADELVAEIETDKVIAVLLEVLLCASRQASR